MKAASCEPRIRAKRMSRVENALYCPWIENYVPAEVWERIGHLVEYVRSTPMINGLTHYQLLSEQKVVLYSFED